MKRIIPFVFLFLVALTAASQASDPAAWWNAWALFFTGADGKPSAVTAANPLPITGTIGSITASLSGDVRITSSTITLPISGTVTAIPTGTQTITGSVIASIPEQISATVTGTVVATIPEAISVGNFPSDQTVTLSNSLGSAANPLTVTGTVVATIPEAVSIANFPADQTVSGNVGISGVASVTQAPPTSFVQHDLIASPTAGSFTTSAGCESLMLRSIDKEMWFSLDGIGATVSYGIPLCASSTGYAQQSFSCGPNTTVYFVASVTTEFKAVESIR